MKRFSLKTRLILSFIFIGLLPMLLVGGFFYYEITTSLKKTYSNKLKAVRDIKADVINNYLENVKSQLLTLSHNPHTIQAMKDLSRSFFSATEQQLKEMNKNEIANFYEKQFGEKYKKENETAINSQKLLASLSPREKMMQDIYIAQNLYPLGAKDKLFSAGIDLEYDQFHSKHHGAFKEFLETFHYYDIFLVDSDSGNIIYSVFKELDFATSLINGPYSKTNFATAFKKAKELNSKKDVVLVDYENYTPSYNAPASFIAAPIWDEDKKIGVLVFQMPINILNSLMNQRSGMGETGESYLVGSNHLLRSDTFVAKDQFNVISSYKKNKVLKSDAIDAVLSGKSGVMISNNYFQQKVISAYLPIDVLGLKWGLLADISYAEAFHSLSTLKKISFFFGAIAIFAIGIVAFMLSSGLSKGIIKVVDSLKEQAKFLNNLSSLILNRSVDLEGVTSKINNSLHSTSSSVEEISKMVELNAQSSDESSKVSDKSREEAVEGKKKVQEMTQSINGISKANDDMAKEMEQNNENISQVIDVIEQIHEKTNVINDIVFQTKLLSFNASVEAARAGEHGKGFAVVADEIGKLASMSGLASKEISELISNSSKEVHQIIDSAKSRVESMIKNSQQQLELGLDNAKSCESSLAAILDNIENTNKLVKEIAQASSEQSQGVSQVNSSLLSLDEVSLKNSQIAKESSLSAKELKEHVQEIDLDISRLERVIFGASSRSKHKVQKNIDESNSSSDQEAMKAA